MQTVSQAFQSAPLGRRVIFPMIFVALVSGGAIVFSLVTALGTLPPGAAMSTRIVASLVPMIVVLFVVPIFLLERRRTSHFRIEENCLVLARKRYPLEGLVSAERDRDVMCWAIRLWGNGGLGAIRGSFWSRRIGRFNAFLTDTEHAVVLRWPDKVVALSPSDPEFFIFTARKAAGLR